MNIQHIEKFVINLPHRTERLQRTRTEIGKLFTNTDFHLMPGVIDKQPMKGIAQAHMNCIQYAKDHQLPYVLIIEDDLHVQSTASRDYMMNAFNNLPDQWDILTSGVYSASNMKYYNKCWNSIEEFSALHFYVVNASAYDRILAFKKDQNIDRWLGKPMQYNGCGLKCYVTEQFFAIQYDGFSDNKNQVMKYSDRLQKFKVLK